MWGVVEEIREKGEGEGVVVVVVCCCFGVGGVGGELERLSIERVRASGSLLSLVGDSAEVGVLLLLPT